MKTIYTKEQKDSVLSKVLQRGDRSLMSISEEVGVPQSTIVSWIHRGSGILPSMKKNRRFGKWEAEEKLRIIMETGSLSESDLGAYLRKEGLHSHQIDEWKTEIISLLKTTRKPKHSKEERESKKVIKTLEREITRKDKALAEASALLILQKKVNLIWGNKDEEEE